MEEVNIFELKLVSLVESVKNEVEQEQLEKAHKKAERNGNQW